MNDHEIVDSSFTAIINNAPLDKVDVPKWCFSLAEADYQGCSPAHIAAGLTSSPEGKRMSINVEVIGGSLMVQHYVGTLGKRDHLILDSMSGRVHAERAYDDQRALGVERQDHRR
jgi:hypothetical protein